MITQPKLDHLKSIEWSAWTGDLYFIGGQVDGHDYLINGDWETEDLYNAVYDTIQQWNSREELDGGVVVYTR